MGQKRSRAVLVGLSAAAGAFAAAAMISAAVAPTARADDFSDILANITAEEGYAQADFSTASSDFASGEDPAGLTALFEGADDDTFGVGYDLHTGLIDLAYDKSVVPASTFDFTFATPATDAAAITEATTIQATGNTDMTTGATDLAAGDFTDGAVYQDLGSIFYSTIPDQVLLVGAFENLLPLLSGV